MRGFRLEDGDCSSSSGLISPYLECHHPASCLTFCADGLKRRACGGSCDLRVMETMPTNSSPGKENSLQPMAKQTDMASDGSIMAKESPVPQSKDATRSTGTPGPTDSSVDATGDVAMAVQAPPADKGETRMKTPKKRISLSMVHASRCLFVPSF